MSRRIRDTLTVQGQPCIAVDAAGFGPIGKSVRSQITGVSIKSTPNCDAALFAALRMEGARRLLEVIESTPEIVIILERWALGILAYGSADGASDRLIRELARSLQSSLPVTTTCLFDVPGPVAYDRIGSEASGNRFEGRGSEYLEQVGQWYRHFAAVEQGIVTVDASGDLGTTYKRTVETLRRQCPEVSKYL